MKEPAGFNTRFKPGHITQVTGASPALMAKRPVD